MLNTCLLHFVVQVLELLDVMGLKQYQEKFRTEQVTGEILSECDEQVLTDDLGVSSKLHRIKLMKVITGGCMRKYCLHIVLMTLFQLHLNISVAIAPSQYCNFVNLLTFVSRSPLSQVHPCWRGSLSQEKSSSSTCGKWIRIINWYFVCLCFVCEALSFS